MENLIIGPAVFLIVGTIFTAVGVNRIRQQRRFVATAKTATGTVIEINEEFQRVNRERRLLKYPVVRFSTLDGQEIEFQSSTGTNPSRYRVGDQVTVLYQPDDPQQAEIQSFLSLWCLTIIMLFLGVVSLVAGIVAAIIVLVVRSVL